MHNIQHINLNYEFLLETRTKPCHFCFFFFLILSSGFVKFSNIFLNNSHDRFDCKWHYFDKFYNCCIFKAMNILWRGTYKQISSLLLLCTHFPGPKKNWNFIVRTLSIHYALFTPTGFTQNSLNRLFDSTNVLWLS